MTYLSDTLTVGLVLILLFGSIALFLYTRIQQAEQKLSLLESILLDLKMAAEIKSYQELPTDPLSSSATHTADSCIVDLSSPVLSESYTPFEASPPQQSPQQSQPSQEEKDSTEEITLSVEKEYEPFEDHIPVSSSHSVASTEYELMTVKELQALAKMRGVVGSSSLKKSGLIEALKASDEQPKETDLSQVSSFVEDRAEVSDEF